jgi:CRISPR-associated protein Cas2
MARSSAWIVAYDIGEPRRRVRVSRWLAARGERVQKSVFVCRLTPAACRRLRRSLERMIDPAEDKLLIEPISGRGFAEPSALLI